MLWTRSVKPIQIGPCALSSLASAQSSIKALRIAAMPPASGKRVAAHQHAAAGRGGGVAARVVGPGERIKHLEEEDEGRDEHALGEAFAAELRHQRGQDIAARTCARATSAVSASGA